jgi:pSer/pThr/pTyr-binding forkhead associated (FHA) protein
MAKITVMFGADPQGDFTLDRDEMRVGRATDCEIVVDNLGVSRHHCSIVKDGDGWAVVDKGSNNGTFVGGQRITKHPLKHGDRVVMGKHSLLYDAHGVADPSDKKKTAVGMGGEMTMFVDQSALAKAMASGDAGAKRMAIALDQGGRQMTVPLLKDETTLGSSPGADIPAKGFLVKAVQAKIVKASGGHHLISLGGWRAVKVNGNKVSDAMLKPGDVISIAGRIFTYKQA